MRRLLALTAFLAVLQLDAKEVTAFVDCSSNGRPFVRKGALSFGYAADPVSGGEEAAIACRRGGAWTFRSSKCDEGTLAFFAKYGLRLFLLLDGDARSMVQTANRIGKSEYACVVSGVQLGTDPSGDGDLAKWRSVARAVARNFPGRVIAVPAADAKAPLLTGLGDALGVVTHLMVDLRGEAAPYAKLDRLAYALRTSQDGTVSKIRLWALAPGRMPGRTEGRECSPASLAWHMHWLMSACSVKSVDGVFFDRPCRKDDFGLLMRHLGASVRGCPTLVAHGEGTGSVGPVGKGRASGVAAPDPDAEEIEIEGEDPFALESDVSAPQACGNVAAGRKGDLEYLAFIGVEGAQVCLVVVNTSGERTRLKLNLKCKTGFAESGFRSGLTPEAKTGGMSNLTTERLHDPLKPFDEWLEPGEIAFIDFRI